MTRHASVSSINCTSCGAGLDVLGGGRVVTHTCPYCGSVLDAQDDYKVLKKFTNMDRPPSPFQIGMSGEINGVTFTIIGTLAHEERHNGRIWRWIDHQLYSPTHGYAFLTINKGHFIFTRRYRKEVRPAWISSERVERSDNRPAAWIAGQRHDYYDTSTSFVTFVEGEFNWQPEKHERSTTVSVLSDNAMIGFTQTETEREIMRSTYLPHAQTLAAFGATNLGEPSGVHPLQPYKAGPESGFVTKVSVICAIVCFLLGMLALLGSGSGPRMSDRYRMADLPVQIPLEIEKPDKITRIRVGSDVNNSWAFLTVGLTDPTDTPVFEAGRTVEQYSGRDSDGYWTEGSESSTLKFIPRLAGTYMLELNLEEAEVVGSGSKPNLVRIEVDQGIVSGFWLFTASVLFVLLAGFNMARYYLHRQRRWWGSDWVEEDDD